MKAGCLFLSRQKSKKERKKSSWQTNISAAVRANDLTYSQFISLLRKTKLKLIEKSWLN